MSEQFTIIDKFYPLPRTSLESNAQKVIDDLKSELSVIIPEYAKKLSRMRKK